MYLAIHLLTYIHTYVSYYTSLNIYIYIHMYLAIHLLTYIHSFVSCYASVWIRVGSCTEACSCEFATFLMCNLLNSGCVCLIDSNVRVFWVVSGWFVRDPDDLDPRRRGSFEACSIR